MKTTYLLIVAFILLLIFLAAFYFKKEASIPKDTLITPPQKAQNTSTMPAYPYGDDNVKG